MTSENTFGFQWNATIPLHSNEVEFSFFKSLFNVKADEFVGKRVLDLGCGNGQYADFALRLGARHVTCVDSSSAILACERNLYGCDASFINSDILSLDSSLLGLFDHVFLIGVAQHNSNPDIVISKAVSFLKPGGVLYFWGYESNLSYALFYQSIRFFTVRLPYWLLWKLCWFPAFLVQFPVFNFILRCFAVSNRALLEERRLSVFDVYATSITKFHSLEKLEGLFNSLGVFYQNTSKPACFLKRLLLMKYESAFAFKVFKS